MDFSKLAGVAQAHKVTNPIQIFEQLPNLPGTPNDIWRGQTEALTLWDENRAKNDVLVELNTGAGKTLVGLLIAQSLVNEGLQNVVYVCATVDLVLQTSKEANKIGITHTLRVDGGYSNDLFEQGKAFCITTYHALFNGYSSIRRRHFPEAVIFDDAHVSEQVLRSCFTLKFNANSHQQLFEEVVELFEPHFRELDKSGEFRNALGDGRAKVVMASPCGVAERKAQLTDIFNRNNIYNDAELKYAFEYLKDRLDRCAVLFGYGNCEITPPFLPSLSIDCLERPIRRIYLSATLKFKSDFIRAYGRFPEVIISPHNDAGNGERLILFGTELTESIDANSLKNLSSDKKVLIATPSYPRAKENWGELVEPAKKENFSSELEKFRQQNSGTFILVQRVDGIDLPHDTCRVMVMDGLPAGSSLLEKFQWEYLKMSNVFASKMANRLAQLFGRINRGRNDYGVFLVSDRELSIWLNNDRYIALMPELIQKQITLGRQVQSGMAIKTIDDVNKVINSVLGREQTWLDYYGANIHGLDVEEDKFIRTQDIENVLTESALAEAKFAKLYWEGDFLNAIGALDSQIENTLRADTPLAGWYSNWLAGIYKTLGDLVSSNKAYSRAKDRLGLNIFTPKLVIDKARDDAPLNSFGQSIYDIVSLESDEKYNKEIRRLESNLQGLKRGTSNQSEASVRALGELLGLHSTRPDNDEGTGPDNLWEDNETDKVLAFELKTEKKASGLLSKKDVGQGHDHIAWVRTNYETHVLIGLAFVSEVEQVDNTANPSEEMSLTSMSNLFTLKEAIFALIEDIRNRLPIERLNVTDELTKQEKWSLEAIGGFLAGKRLA